MIIPEAPHDTMLQKKPRENMSNTAWGHSSNVAKACQKAFQNQARGVLNVCGCFAVKQMCANIVQGNCIEGLQS